MNFVLALTRRAEHVCGTLKSLGSEASQEDNYGSAPRLSKAKMVLNSLSTVTSAALCVRSRLEVRKEDFTNVLPCVMVVQSLWIDETYLNH